MVHSQSGVTQKVKLQWHERLLNLKIRMPCCYLGLATELFPDLESVCLGTSKMHICLR